MNNFFSKLLPKKKESTPTEIIGDDFDVTGLDDELFQELGETNTQENLEREELLDTLEVEAKKEAEKIVNKRNRKSISLDKNTQFFISNFILVLSIIVVYYVFSTQTVDTLKSIEIYKGDIQKVEKDNKIVLTNLELLEEERGQALEYRKLNYFLEQAVPTSDKYEDNLVVILKILDESISTFSKNKKYLEGLTLRPDTEIRDVEIFNSDTERIVGISYNLSVSGFTRYKDIQDFINLVTGRLRIFHISNLSITKIYDQQTNVLEYKLQIQMYSYYRLPKVDEMGNIIEIETDASF